MYLKYMKLTYVAFDKHFFSLAPEFGIHLLRMNTQWCEKTILDIILIPIAVNIAYQVRPGAELRRDLNAGQWHCACVVTQLSADDISLVRTPTLIANVTPMLIVKYL